MNLCNSHEYNKSFLINLLMSESLLHELNKNDKIERNKIFVFMINYTF